jgi:hypothetical protein
MKSLCFGFALASAAFGLASSPVSAVEAPALVSKAPSGIINARQPLTDQQRCANVRQVCHERYRDRGYRQCVTRERCLP